MLTHSDTISITVNMPLELFNRAQYFIEKGYFSGEHVLILTALEQFISELEEQESESEFESFQDFEDPSWDDQPFEDYDEDDWQEDVDQEMD